MARGVAAEFGSLGRACARGVGRLAVNLVLAALALLTLASPGICQQEAVRGEAIFAAAGGYARMTLKLAEDVEPQVSTAGSIVVIRFKRPVDIAVDKLSDAVPDYVGSARRDPDGSAIRLSLSRRVTVNTMTAGERVFIDFLPDSWTGPPPPLPQEVIRELSERARAAERALRQARSVADTKKRPPIRVRTSIQPTFVRFVFEMPDGIGVSSVLNDQKLTLMFNARLTFDLADAKVSSPPNIASIDQKVEGETTTVQILLMDDVDIRSFREDKNYVIDVAFQQPDKPAPQASTAQHAPAHSAPAAMATPAAGIQRPAVAIPPIAAPPASARPAEDAHAPSASDEVTPPTSEMLASQAKIAITPHAEAPPVKATAAADEAPPAPKHVPAPVADAAPKIVAPAPAPAPAKAPEPQPAPAAGKARDSTASVEARRDSDALRLIFSFASATPAAMFRRADAIWLVFDSTEAIDVDPVRGQGGALVADVNRFELEKGQAIRIRLNRPQIPSLKAENEAGGSKWTVTFADMLQSPTQALSAIRNIADPVNATVIVSLAGPGMLHRLVDTDAGDTLMVVTAPGPIRGIIKRQDFVEMSLLESIHGVAIRPNSDDLAAEVAGDKISIGRPGGLTLSPADAAADRATLAVRPIFDVVEWQKNKEDNFITRERELIAAAGMVDPALRTPPRLDLARFYLANGLYPETKGVLDLVLASAKPGREDSTALLMRSIASTLMGRPEQGMKDLANPAMGTSLDSQLWKALALARQSKWPEAREKFKNVEFAITALPFDLQRIVLTEAMRASLEVKDYPGVARRASELEVVGLSPATEPAVAVLRGRLAEALGHDKDARKQYGIAMESSDRLAAAEAKLLDIVLRLRREEVNQADALRELETLSALWRGDAIEAKTLQMMARIYADTGRFSESLGAARTATVLLPNSESARQSQDAASALFAQLFLSKMGEDLPPVDALGMFYDYRELTPIGRRGDEMIRRLAERLVGVDLLDQASQLLQYQVDHRLEGAARAQVAARLAMVYLSNRKPDRAITALRVTRIADLAGELRQQRLLLEARAQSDVGRHDLALDIISNLAGREAIRLRSDIYWASRRWRESAEQIELYYADRWRDFKPLSASEKSDVIRAVVGYSLAEDVVGLARFREKYAPLMNGEVDRFAFEIAGKPANGNSADFVQIAKMAASVDTLDGFMREMKARFPDATARAPVPAETGGGEPVHTGSLPAIVGVRQVEATR